MNAFFVICHKVVEHIVEYARLELATFRLPV